MKSAKPFVKWLGGKAKVSEHVLSRLPDKINVYFEPFVGGGCILFRLAAAEKFKKAVIADTNPDLINAYKVIKKNVEDLIKILQNGNYVYDKDTYLRIRAMNPDNLDKVQCAARFIYLNKTCFNGLYRVNLNGEFNTPFGDYKDPLICDADNLRLVSQVLKKVQVMQCDFVKACEWASKGDAIYFDPPYIPISNTSKFVNYTSSGFNYGDHVRLRDTFASMVKQGVRTIVSNSSAPEAIELYEGYDIDYLTGSRCVGGPASYRKSVKEILVFAGQREYQVA